MKQIVNRTFEVHYHENGFTWANPKSKNFTKEMIFDSTKKLTNPDGTVKRFKSCREARKEMLIFQRLTGTKIVCVVAID